MFMNRKAFDEIRRLNGIESASQFYIRFQNENGLKKTIADIMQQYNLTAENVKENTAVLGTLGAIGSGLFCYYIDCRCIYDFKLYE